MKSEEASEWGIEQEGYGYVLESDDPGSFMIAGSVGIGKHCTAVLVNRDERGISLIDRVEDTVKNDL